MKRILAFIIDFFAMLMIVIVVNFVLIIVIWKKGLGDNLIMAVISIFILLMPLFICLYFFISDYYGHGSSVGKKLAGIKLMSHGKELSLPVSIKHAVLKTIACCIYPVSFLYFLCKEEMPYDKWLGLEVVGTKKQQGGKS